MPGPPGRARRLPGPASFEGSTEVVLTREIGAGRQVHVRGQRQGGLADRPAGARQPAWWISTASTSIR